MKLNPEYFDMIRVIPTKEEDRTAPLCSWRGCQEKATYPAPKGREHEGEYLYFCLLHVREYNKSYNYFSGMNDQDMASYLKKNITGHRPTWFMGARTTSPGEPTKRTKTEGSYYKFSDSFAFRKYTKHQEKQRKVEERERPVIRNAERASLTTLGLDIDATPEQIKLRYKELLKRNHPDANGGDRSMEDTLRAIIQAYDYLKSTGFC